MPAPTRLGKYEVRRELGKGSMGVVYEAFDPFIERRVAIKVIREDELSPGANRDLLTRLKREAQAAGRLNHPGIVAIYDYGEEDATQGDSGLAYIAMELIDGRELKDYFDADHQFPTQDVVRVMEEVLAALQHAHERGVTHRDIKPSNVILLRNGRVKVADFGVARLDTSELTQAGTMIGTPMYMSPEQILGLPVDGRADLFSCGVVLYQFLTGEKPFTGSIATVMQKVLHHNPPPVTQLNNTLAPAWDGVLRTALAKKPEDRYQSATAMMEAIRRAALEPAPGQKDEVTVLLPRPAAGVTLPPLTAPMPGRLAQTQAAARTPQQGGMAGGTAKENTSPVAHPPAPAGGSGKGIAGPDAGLPASNATGRPAPGGPGASGLPAAGGSSIAKPSASAPGHAAGTAAQAAGTSGTMAPPPPVSPTWSAAGTSSAAAAGTRAGPYLGSQGTSTSALATVVANALSGPSATLRPPAPPPPPPAVAPRLGAGPRAAAVAAVVGAAALAAYLAWPSRKSAVDDKATPAKPPASQAAAASGSGTAVAPSPSDLRPVQSAAASAGVPTQTASPAPMPAPAPTTVGQANAVTSPDAPQRPAATSAGPGPGKSTPVPMPAPPAPPPVAAVTPRPSPAPGPAPTPAPVPAPAAAPAVPGAAAFSQEWRPRLAKLEAMRGPQTLASALSLLLEPMNAEERALATDFEAQFKLRPMPSALVVGVIDGHLRANWQTRGQSPERAMEQARKRCFEQSVAGCSVVLLNGEFQRDAFLTAARELGAQPPSAVRARVLRGFERSLSEWRQADAGARPASASGSYPSPAPAPAPTATAPAPAAKSAEALAAEAAQAEWSQALGAMRAEGPSNFSRGLELLLRTSGEDNERLSRFQSALKRMRWNSAVAMGEKNGYLVFAWSHSERRPDWAQERALADCSRAAAAPCALVMADGSYANAGLMTVGARLGGRNQQVVRENFMRYVQRKLQEGLG